MYKKINSLLLLLPLIVVLATTITLRVVNLGYSDYQGDEIKSLFILEKGESLKNFFLTQRKGPGQFVVTYFVKLFNSDYTNEFLTRIPFAIGSILSVFFFYKLIEKIFNKKIAFYSSFFLATNGFFVAFGRISQYQSFVILFMILSLFMLLLSIKEEKYKFNGLILGFIFWALSILFHYDGIFIAPFIVYFLIIWVKQNIKKIDFKDKSLKFMILSVFVFLVLLGLFYIPFLLNLSKETLDYWNGRIEGVSSTKMSSTTYLFNVYQPIYALHIYQILSLLGFAYIFLGFIKKIFTKNSLINKLMSFDFNIFTTAALLIWFITPFLFMEKFVSTPGTHIYTYLLPLFIVLGIGIYFIEKVLNLFKKFFIPYAISGVCIGVVFIFLFLQSYAIFVNHTVEYPWESEKFYIWEFSIPDNSYNLSLFGFPYYRNWEGIRNVVLNSLNNGNYSTNERETISSYYIPFNKDADLAGDYIQILNPQSFKDVAPNSKPAYWADRYHPVFTFSRNGNDLVRVYYMQPGTLKEIQLKGY